MSSSVLGLRVLFDRVDERAVRVMSTRGILLLRTALAIVFIWFGVLKVIGRSPVADLVAQTVWWVPSDFFVPFLGVWETAVGVGLLFGLALCIALFLFWLQMASTFSVLVLRPGIAFQGGNPLLLTTEGEFAVKNLVLIAGGLVVGSTVRRRWEKAKGQQAPTVPQKSSK